MFCVTYRVDRSGHATFETTDNCHIGSHLPANPFDPDITILAIQADGPELQLIKSLTTGLHMTKTRTVTWVGEDARFILANWISLNHTPQIFREETE